MPSGATHRAIARAYGLDSREVDRLLDSTVHQHGPSHRKDPIHSLPGVARALAMQGKLTTKNLQSAALHLASDKAISDMMRRTGLKGTRRRVTQDLLEEAIRRWAEQKGP